MLEFKQNQSNPITTHLLICVPKMPFSMGEKLVKVGKFHIT